MAESSRTTGAVCWFLLQLIVGLNVVYAAGDKPAAEATPLASHVAFLQYRKAGFETSTYSGGFHFLWQGEIDLGGSKWHLAAADNSSTPPQPEGKVNRRIDYLVVRPWESRTNRVEQYSAYAPVFGVLSPPPQNLFLQGHGYQMAYEFEGQGEAARLRVVFTEKLPKLGELTLTGQFVKRLYLDGDYCALLDSPKPVVKIPAGSYRQSMVLIQKDGAAMQAWGHFGDRLDIAENGSARLPFGGPLQHKVTANRQGHHLILSYRLVGQDEQSYNTLAGSAPCSPIRIAIYCGDKPVNSGEIEFACHGARSYSWRVPARISGKLRIVASADLGGLGAKESASVYFDWPYFSRLPKLIPWLLILALMFLKPNRRAEAWLVLLPLVSLQAILLGLFLGFTFIPAEPRDFFYPLYSALTFGLAGAWLLSSTWRLSPGRVPFVAMLLAQGVVGMLALVAQVDWEESRESLLPLLFLGAHMLAISAGMSLAALSCRRRFRPAGFVVRLCGCLLAQGIVLMVVALDFLILTERPTFAAMEMLSAGLVLGVIAFLFLVPFVLLSFISPLYRDRFLAAYRLSMPSALPILAPVLK